MALQSSPGIGAGVWIGGLSLLSAGFSFYHGYKKNYDSLGYGLLWGAAGALFPIITPAVAVVDGYAEPDTAPLVRLNPGSGT